MTSQFVTLVNGVPADKVDVTDRGLQFGDGVFETIAVQNGHPVWLERHLARIRAGCQQLKFQTIPEPELLSDEVCGLCRGHEQAVLKMIITRGYSFGGYGTADGSTPNRVMILKPGVRHSQNTAREGIHAGICQQRIASHPVLAGIKHLNRLDQVLARIECQGRWQEGLMLCEDGHVVEGIMSNLFLVRDDVLITPGLDRAGIRGLARDAIIDIASRNGMDIEIREVQPAELDDAAELFVCNSLIGIWPITRLENYRYPIGPQTSWLQQELAEAMC